MDRQHSSPIHIDANGTSSPLKLVPKQGIEANWPESRIQALVHKHPDALPIAEIDPMFVGAVSVCTEMQLGKAGRVDNFLITPSGLPVLVECKLWRNPEARREVIGQILDYAKVLSRWSFSDLQREVAVRTGSDTNELLNIARRADSAIDEVQFTDAVTVNLRRGRFLLLILGDGIREDVEAIAEHLQAHAGLHFTFGLVEFPIYALPNGEQVVTPRVIARTTSIIRNVVSVPEGHVVEEAADGADDTGSGIDPDRAALGDAQQVFWKEFLASYLQLDDRSQQIPKPARLGYLSFMLPAPQGSSWLTVYRDQSKGEVGVFLSASRSSPGEDAMRSVIADWDAVALALKGTARIETDRYDRPRIIDSKVVGNLNDPDTRKTAFEWLGERVNAFVNAMRPRIRDAVADNASLGS